MKRALTLAIPATVLWGLFQASELNAQKAEFPHETHSAFFSECTACHAGIGSGATQEVYPDYSTCTACHDGATAPSIQWEAPEPRASSLKFTHTPHASGCNTCHGLGAEGDPVPMTFPAPETCIGCHSPGTDHQQAEQCGFCHARVVDFRLAEQAGAAPFHGESFITSHGAAASTGLPDCTSCHSENTCTQCHDGLGSPDFHPLNFLASHGPEAYGRLSDCSTCHSTEAFCRECHLGLGFNQSGGLFSTFHNDQGLGFFGHALGARQDLESCVSCHQQTDCMRCHSARTGLGVTPHGPGFDLSNLNLAGCKLCH